MEWKCITCEHINDQNNLECESCGAHRNLYAEETLQHLESIKKLENNVKALKRIETLFKYKNDLLTKQLNENKIETERLLEAEELVKNQNSLLKYSENTLKKSIELKNNAIIDLRHQITSLKNNISDKEIDLKNKTNELVSLKNQLKITTDKLNNKHLYIYYMVALLVSSVSLFGYIYYKQVYIVNQKSNYITDLNERFSMNVDTLNKDCFKEIIGARYVSSNDLNNDGIQDGVVIASFNGINCLNSFETKLFIYKSCTLEYPLVYSLSKSNESYYSFRGFEAGQLLFDKWNLKDYNQSKYDANSLKNSHTRVYISLESDTLSTKIL